MKAITVVPGEPEAGTLLVQGRLLGVCGTDVDIVEHGYGWPPHGTGWLSVTNRSAPSSTPLLTADSPPATRSPGSCAVPTRCRASRAHAVSGTSAATAGTPSAASGARRVRRRALAHRAGLRCPPRSGLGDCGVLLEPASVLAKAWEQTDRIFTRASWRPAIALVTSAGPIGLFAALLGVQRGLEVHVLDRVATGPKAQLVADLGATFHTGEVKDIGVTPDAVIDCTGHGPLVFELATVVAPDAVICLTGISSGTRTVTVGLDELNKALVLENTVLFGSVNAGRRHYEQAADALARVDRTWLERLITRRVPMSGFADALHKRDDDVKVVVDLKGS